MDSIVEAVQKPFQSLECIRITTTNRDRLCDEPDDARRPKKRPIVVREAFLGGSAPPLMVIKLDGIAFPFPAIRQVLSSAADNLLELHLANIPNDLYFHHTTLSPAWPPWSSSDCLHSVSIPLLHPHRQVWHPRNALLSPLSAPLNMTARANT